MTAVARLAHAILRENARTPDWPERVATMEAQATGDRPCDAWLRETQERIRSGQSRFPDLDVIAAWLAKQEGADDVAAEGYRIRAVLGRIKQQRDGEKPSLRYAVRVHRDGLDGRTCNFHGRLGIECEAEARDGGRVDEACCVTVEAVSTDISRWGSEDHASASRCTGLPHPWLINGRSE